MATIILKATEACNSNCIYCEVVSRKQPKRMKFETLSALFQRINDFLEEFPRENIHIVWHGGEPLLLGKDYYYDAINLINKHCRFTQNRISHSIQTNLTLLNEDFIEVFKALKINAIGTSYDPLPNIRGIGNARDTREYNLNFIKSTRLLEKNNIKWGFIFVVTKQALPKAKEIFYFATNFNKKFGFNIHPVDYYGSSSTIFEITPEEFAGFLGEIFPIWYHDIKRYPGVEPFSSFLRIYKNNERMHGCSTSGNCAHSHIYIGPDGNTSHCGRFGDIDVYDYGNILQHSLKEILYHKKRNDFKIRSEILLADECKDCELWDICKGGCPAEAYYHHETIYKKTFWCDSTRLFLKKYFEPITGLKKEFEYVPG